MSSVASSTVGRTGPRRSPRQFPATARRRTFSTSVSTTSNGSLPRVTLAEWQVPSLSDFHSSKAGSPVELDVILQRHFPTGRHESSSSSGNGAGLHRASTTGPRRAPLVPKRDVSVYPRRMSALPPLPAPAREEEIDMSRRPGIRDFLSTVTSRLDSKEPSMQRPSGASAETNQTLVPPVRPILDDARPLSFTYDPQSRRLTGLEDWQTHFPNELRDPFAGLEVSEAELEHITSLSSVHDIYKVISRRITQKLEILASTAKARIPQVFKLMINTLDKRTQDDEPHEISGPFNVVHSMTVRSDPTTGRIQGMPEQWVSPTEEAKLPGTTTRVAGAKPARPAERDAPHGSFWGVLRRQPKGPREALKNIQLSRSTSTSHPPVRRNSRPHRASFSEQPTRAQAAGDHKGVQILPSSTNPHSLSHVNPPPIRAQSAAVRKPRRKAVPQLTEGEWQQIFGGQAPQVRTIPQPPPVTTTFVQAHRPPPVPYVGPAYALSGFPRQRVPMYAPNPVFFGSYDDLTFSR